MKSLDPILVSNFPCYFCPVSGSIKISLHLASNSSCREKYFKKFKVHTVKELLSLLVNLKRRLNNSRSRVRRSLENKKKKETIISDFKSRYDLINSFRQDTKFANVKVCIKCKRNIVNGEIVSPEDIAAGVIEVDPSLRRFQSFFQCRNCSRGDTSDTSDTSPISRFEITQRETGGRVHCFPSMMLLDDFEHNSQSAELDTDAPIVCLFPSSLEALHHISVDGIKSRFGEVGVMYQNKPDIDRIISMSYENEMHKYKVAKIFSDRYHGTLNEDEDKVRLPCNQESCGSWGNP